MSEALEDQAMNVIERPPALPVRILPTDRRVLALFEGTPVADSRRALLLLEDNHLPVYYFPKEDVRMDLMEPSSRRTRCPHKGEASYWSLTVAGRTAEDALWAYEDPIPEASALGGHVAFYWHKVDSWFEEDDEVFAHPRDPYHRVDVLNSSRHVRVVVDGETVAETMRPRLLFETGLPVRYYIPKLDVSMDRLRPTKKRTRCPYKGEASYWTLELGDTRLDDIVWSYPAPIPECPKIENLLSFFNERVDIYVDGELMARPVTPWSRK